MNEIEKKENQLVKLPNELEQIAKDVTTEKRSEVKNVLNTVFSGVSKMREQLDNVTVSGIDDKLNMKLANTIRLSVRQVRLDAEKTFDAKRAEVQMQMLSYKTEDALWLKAKQTMQILTKEIEENARWKEETKERYESEQKELKVQQRMIKVSVIAPELDRSEFENMSDEAFEMFYAGIEKSYNDKIEAERIEEEKRLAKIKADEEERKRINAENERLKAEAAERDRLAEIERKKQEKIIQAEREKAAKEKALADEKLEKEKQEKLKIENQLKKEREEKEKKEKEEAEKIRLAQLEKEAEEEKRLSSSDSEKAERLIKDIQSLIIPEMSSKEYKQIIKLVEADIKIIIKKLKASI